jgi:glycosyltransferase involved in cell wall biosynthesis
MHDWGVQETAIQELDLCGEIAIDAFSKNCLHMSDRCISVIICTYDRYDLVGEAIESVLVQTNPPLELIVVDNSPDAAAALAFGARYQSREKIRYVREPIEGLSQARNTAVALARGDIVAFLDDDAAAEPGWAEALMRAFAEFPDAGCVGGRVVSRWLSHRPVWLDRELLGYLSIVDWGGSLREIEPGEWLAGCNIAYDRRALIDAGGFPVSLGRKGGTSLLSNEEIVVNRKLRSLGKSVVYAPEAVVRHRVPAGRLTQEWFLRRAAWQAVSDFVAFSSPPEKRRLRKAELLWLSLLWPGARLKWRMNDLRASVLERLNREPKLIENLDAEGGEFLAASLDIRF